MLDLEVIVMTMLSLTLYVCFVRGICASVHSLILTNNYRGYGETDKPHGVKNYAMSVLIEDVSQLVSCCIHVLK